MNWPTLDRTHAFHGIAGEIVRKLEPDTEADPVAILGQLLVAIGNAIGRKPHFMVEGTPHHTNLYLNLVGETSRGRKGTSWGRVCQLMKFVDPDWERNCITSGLSSGEGLIFQVSEDCEEADDE